MIACVIFSSPWWLRPHAPIKEADAIILEGYLSDQTIEGAVAYLQAHPECKVFTTGGARQAWVYKSKVPGELIWRFSPPDSLLAGGVFHRMRFKAHGKGNAQGPTSWSVRVDDQSLLDREFANYDAQSLVHYSAYPHIPPREISIEMTHEQPDSTCHWVIWYLMLDGLECVPQKIWFIPEDEALPHRRISATYAEFARDHLINAGIDSSRVEVVPPILSRNMRTYHGAMGLAEYISRHHPELRQLNLLSADFHARRSWATYSYALGSQIDIGIIRPDVPISAGFQHWKQYSEREGWLIQLKKYIGWHWLRLTGEI